MRPIQYTRSIHHDSYGGDGIDIGSDDIGLHFIRSNPLGRFSMIHRVDQGKEFPGAPAVTERSKRHRSPDSALGVLPAIFPNSGDVPFDIAGIQI